MAIDGKNRSPHQTFGRATWEPDPGDADLLPKPTVHRGSTQRNYFGGQERGGARGGDLHPDGQGPYPDDIFSATDIEGLPWVRQRGNEWTTADLRAAVLAWLAKFFRGRESLRLIGWKVTERANSPRMGSTRLNARDHYLRFEIQFREGKGTDVSSVETAIAFPPDDREATRVAVKLALVEQTLDALLAQ